MKITSEEQSIQVFSEDVDFAYERVDQLQWWLLSTIESEDHEVEFINIIFCSDGYLLALNKEHLQHDYYTDIITFQYSEKPLQGDLYISVDRVEDNANQRRLSFDEELHRVVIHGILHMCGYDDKTDDDRALMREKENEHLLHRITGQEIA